GVVDTALPVDQRAVTIEGDDIVVGRHSATPCEHCVKNHLVQGSGRSYRVEAATTGSAVPRFCGRRTAEPQTQLITTRNVSWRAVPGAREGRWPLQTTPAQKREVVSGAIVA